MIEFCKAEDVPEGGRKCGHITDAEGNERGVVVLRTADGLFCIENACPHAGLPLEDGDLRGNSIICPFHGYTYRLSDGADVDDPEFGQPVPTFPVTVEGDRVMIRLPEPPASE